MQRHIINRYLERSEIEEDKIFEVTLYYCSIICGSRQNFCIVQSFLNCHRSNFNAKVTVG